MLTLDLRVCLQVCLWVCCGCVLVAGVLAGVLAAGVLAGVRVCGCAGVRVCGCVVMLSVLKCLVCCNARVYPLNFIDVGPLTSAL
jgi:hypothetical protein